MLHGRSLSRCRVCVRWTLFLLLLACMSAGVDYFWPPAPRWVMRESLHTLGYGRDGKSFVTAAARVIVVGMLEECSSGPVQIRDVTTGNVLASFFDDAYEVQAAHQVPTLDNTMMVGVRLRMNSGWEFHLVDLANLRTRKLDFTLSADRLFGVNHAPDLPFVAIRHYHVDEKKRDEAELCLFDLESNRVVGRWIQPPSWYEVVFGKRALFASHGLSEAGNIEAYSWDLLDRKPIAEEKNFHEVRVGWDQAFAVTIKLHPPSRQRIKLWDLNQGKVVSEVVVRSGDVELSRDATWAMIRPDGGEIFELWNLLERRKVGDKPARNLDPGGWNIVQAGGRSIMIVTSKKELSAHDAATLEPLWSVPSTSESAFGRECLLRETPQGTVLVLLDNDIEVLDLITGAVIQRIPLIDGGVFDGIFEHSNQTHNPVMLYGQFARRTPLAGWRIKLEDWGLLEPQPGFVYVAAVVDFDAGRILFKRQLMINDSASRAWLSADARTVILNYEDRNGKRILECWDVPMPRPWLPILCVPLATGAGMLSTHWVWRRFRPVKGKV